MSRFSRKCGSLDGSQPDSFTQPFFFFLVSLNGVKLDSRPLFGLLYQPRMINDGDCRAIGAMRIGRGNRSTRRKSTPVPLCPPQIPHELTLARNKAAAATNRLSYGMAYHGLLQAAHTTPLFLATEEHQDSRRRGTLGVLNIS
jgi:hypothetical protein